MSRGTQTSLKVKLLTLGLAVGYLLALAMAVSPALHHWIHPDSDGPDHHCVATTLADGQVDSPLLTPILAAPVPAASCSVDLSGQEFELPAFSAAFALEHAPPRA